VRDPRLAPFRAPALAFALFLVICAVSAAVLFVLKLGPGVARLREFYLGSEARFAAPRTLGGLLQVAVPHLLAIPFVLFAASHLVGFARAIGPRAFAALVRLSYGSALLGVAAGLGVRFVAPGLAWVKIGAFAGLEAGLVAWAGLLVRVFGSSHVTEGAPEALRRERAPDETASAAGGTTTAEGGRAARRGSRRRSPPRRR
jgi:hypothetical protein